MTRLADDVLRRLRNDIVAGTYPPGARLTESQLCTAYDVSRVPVREALKQLEVEGFVASRAYAGVTVGQMHVDDAADLFSVRKTIEAITARRCADRFRRSPHDPEAISFASRLDSLVSAGSAAASRAERDELPPLNTEFHLVLADFSGNPSLLSLLRQVASKIEWLYGMDVDVRGEHSWAEHRSIAGAVLAGDVTRSSRLMREHVDNSLTVYLQRHPMP